MLSQSVQISVAVVENPDGTYRIGLLRNSTVFSNGVPLNTTQPAEFEKKDFPTRKEAEAEAQRVANHFSAAVTYP